MEIEKSRLLIGTVTHESKDYCQREFIKQLSRMRHPNYDVLIVDNSKTDKNFEELHTLKEEFRLGHKYNQFYIEKDVWHFDARGRICTSYNKIREFFLKGDYTHLLLIESDIFIKTKKFIEKWILANKPLITAMYQLHNINRPPSKENDPEWRWQYSVWYKRRIIEKNQLWQKWIEKDKKDTGMIPLTFDFNGYGTGLVMFERDLLYQIIFKFGFGTADSYIKNDLDAIGIESWLDTDVDIDHQNKVWDSLIESDVAEVKKLQRCGKELRTLKKKEEKK